jgi:hypothetical protein
MTERELQLLGFEREEYGDWDGDHHYYSYQITNGMSFISAASDEIGEDGHWYVDVFNTQDPIRFWKFEKVQSLINTLEKHLIKND